MQTFATDLCFVENIFFFFNIFLWRLVFTHRDKVNVAYHHILLKGTVHVIHPSLKVAWSVSVQHVYCTCNQLYCPVWLTSAEKTQHVVCNKCSFAISKCISRDSTYLSLKHCKMKNDDIFMFLIFKMDHFQLWFFF